MKFINKCTKTRTDSKIVFKEKRSTIEFSNDKNEEVTQIEVDDCQLKSGFKCDWLLIHKEKEYFIELKGNGVAHAFQQIATTIEKLHNSTNNIYACISATRVPSNSNSRFNIQKRRLIKKYKIKKLYLNSGKVKIKIS